jgi:type IV secretory pathway VirB2 component (pilin)
MITMTVIQAVSLTDSPPDSAITSATIWISDLLFGPLATSIAIIAIAWVGFSMLSGRIEIRRGLAVVFGCFLLFGAKGIAEGLRSTATIEGAPPVANAPPPPNFQKSSPSANKTDAYDPYAGASVGGSNQ